MECVQPRTLITREGQLVGLRCVRTQVEGRRAYPCADSEFDLLAPLFISSIGSVPQEFPGLVMVGDRYQLRHPESGELTPANDIFGVGNAVSGQGNIRVSLRHATQVADHLIEQVLPDKSLLSIANQQALLARVAARQQAIGYQQYSTWIASDPPPDRQLALDGSSDTASTPDDD
jgi:hypothetical protein